MRDVNVSHDEDEDAQIRAAIVTAYSAHPPTPPGQPAVLARIGHSEKGRAPKWLLALEELRDVRRRRAERRKKTNDRLERIHARSTET